MLMSCRGSVEVDRDSQLRPQTLAQAVRCSDAFDHADTFKWDERDHVQGAHPGMHTLMAAQVDRLDHNRSQPENRLGHVLQTAGERENGPVVIGVRRIVEEIDPWRTLDRRAHLSQHVLIPALGNIRNALYPHVHGSFFVRLLRSASLRGAGT